MRKLVKNNISWVGYIDWELEKFHGDDYSIMKGSSQIDLHKIDYIVANHGECDHSGTLTALMAEIDLLHSQRRKINRGTIRQKELELSRCQNRRQLRHWQ